MLTINFPTAIDIMALNDIESEIKKRFDDYSSKTLGPGKKNYDYILTKRLKEIIANFGHEMKYKVCAGGCEGPFENEWLYEVAWTSSNELGLKRVEMVYKSELAKNFNGIKAEFEKLLLANAKMKIFVCTTIPGMDEEIQNYFEKAIQNYEAHAPNTRFLILIWDDTDTGEFVPYLTLT